MDRELERKKNNNGLITEIEPVINGLGFSVVEFTAHRNRVNLTVSLIIYKESGINLDDCSMVYKTVLPRIEVLEDNRSVHLEVSSPGISRSFKTADEFTVFSGQSVKVLKNDETEWVNGTIVSVNENSVSLKNKNETVVFDFKDINKAKLEK